MNWSALLWLARADFLERTRRTSFLLVLGAALWMMWLVYTGTLTVQLEDWRGVFNSAWLGMMLTTLVAVFVSLLGFYIVKDPLTRDRATGVGQIIAATPTSNALYLAGKWLSNTAVLATLILVCGLAALALQVARAEAATADLEQLFLPILLLAVPALAVIAGAALVFESVGWLRGGVGNVVFFFLWVFGVIGSMAWFGEHARGLDPFGLSVFLPELQAQVKALDPTYDGGLLIGGGTEVAKKTFVWAGPAWTLELVVQRVIVLFAGLGLAVLPAFWFDRFRTPAAARAGRAAFDITRRMKALDALLDTLGMVGAELRMLLAGQPWWWLATFAALAVAQSFQADVLVFAWLWPVLAWSALGCRAERDGMLPLIMSTPRPVLRPVLAAWTAGALLAALAGLGALAARALAGDWAGVLAFAIACAAIPALALACGAVAGSPRLFEILWLCVWYAGPAQRIATFDMVRMRDGGDLLRWTAIAALALALTLAVRARRLATGKL